MPIEIQITDDLGVNFSSIGNVTGEEVILNTKKVYQLEVFPSLRYWLVDNSLCTKYDVSTGEIIQLAELSNSAAKNNSKLLVAYVSELECQFGMSRMLEAYIDDDGINMKSFHDRVTAVQWIRLELETDDKTNP